MEETHTKVKLSAAARRELLDRTRGIHEPPNEHHGRGYGSGVWFGHGDNAVTRELEAAGLVDRVPIGWSSPRIINRIGYELALALHAERARLMAGVPISEWKPQGGLRLLKGPWTCVKIADGRYLHCDGYMMAFGEMEHTETSDCGRGLPKAEVLRDRWERIMPHLYGLRPVTAVAWQYIGTYCADGVVWFSNGHAMNDSYYRHIMKLYPKGVWAGNGSNGPMGRVVDGAVVASAMPMRIEHVPAIVQAVAA
jgi:hypothetical protein